MKALAL